MGHTISHYFTGHEAECVSVVYCRHMDIVRDMETIIIYWQQFFCPHACKLAIEMITLVGCISLAVGS